MESKCGDGSPGVPCCGGGADKAKGSSGSAADCGCGAPPGGRRWLKALISAIVILAALGVGLVSLVAGRGGRGSPQTAAPACCPAGAVGGTPGQPECGGCPGSAGSDSTQAARPVGENSQTPCGGN